MRTHRREGRQRGQRRRHCGPGLRHLHCARREHDVVSDRSVPTAIKTARIAHLQHRRLAQIEGLLEEARRVRVGRERALIRPLRGRRVVGPVRRCACARAGDVPSRLAPRVDTAVDGRGRHTCGGAGTADAGAHVVEEAGRRGQDDGWDGIHGARAARQLGEEYVTDIIGWRYYAGGRLTSDGRRERIQAD